MYRKREQKAQKEQKEEKMQKEMFCQSGTTMSRVTELGKTKARTETKTAT